jgi:hypothetical protein
MRANQYLDQRARGFSRDEIAAKLGRLWAGTGYDGASAGDGTWPAVRSARQVFTGAATDERGQEILARWQAMQ